VWPQQVNPMSEAKDSLNKVGDMLVLLFLVYRRLFRFLGFGSLASDAPRSRNCSTLSRPKKSSSDSVADFAAELEPLNLITEKKN
jgi:hypothetical protein